MKKLVLALTLACLTAAPALATEDTSTSKFGLGIDFAMPYTLMVDGDSSSNRGNVNLGLDARYWTSANMNWGMRFAFGLEDQFNTGTAIALSPGMQYHWMADSSFRPFFRLDIPMTIVNYGADDFELGTSVGLGLAWNFGEAIGVQNMSIRYDFDMFYNYGLGANAPVLGMEVFKIGFDYKF